LCYFLLIPVSLGLLQSDRIAPAKAPIKRREPRRKGVKSPARSR